ncbi:UNVERIFIED_ORG: hypothetical protein J2W85_006091 [Ensifer adhaerens]|jgi:hypothetical protein|nr:hypothetical protein [Ensifer adhaerens]
MLQISIRFWSLFDRASLWAFPNRAIFCSVVFGHLAG